MLSERELRRRIAGTSAPGEQEAGERGWRLVAAAYADREPVRSRRVPWRAARCGRARRRGRPGRRQPARPRRARLAASGDRRRARRAGALRAPGARAARRGRARRGVGRLGRRLEAPARRLHRRVVVAVRPLRRRRARARARRARARRDGALDARPPRGRVPALGRHRDRHAHRLPRGTAPPCRRRRRRRRPTTSGCRARRAVAPAWQPASAGRELLLAYADTRGRVHVYAPGSRTPVFTTAPGPVPTKLAWSTDGRRLLALSPGRLQVYDRGGRVVESRLASFADAAFLPGGAEVVVGAAHRDRDGGRAARYRPRAVPRRRPPEPGRRLARRPAAAASPGRRPTSGSSSARRAAHRGPSPTSPTSSAARFPTVGGWATSP